MNNSITPCFFQVNHLPILCGGSKTELGNLLFASIPPRDFRSMLEYLLFRAGLFNLEKKNLCRFSICERHLEYLTGVDRQNSCKVCKPIRERPTSGTSYLQLVSKSMALRIWHVGYPTHNWAVYGRTICTSCRKYFQSSDDTEEATTESSRIFDWIYDQSIVYLPTPSEHSSQHSNFELPFEHLPNSQRQHGFDILKHCLHETGYTGRVQRTSSYKTLSNHSRYNVRNQAAGIMQHVLKLVINDDADGVWTEIFDNNESNSFKNQNEVNEVMMSLSSAYAYADHFSTKRQILAIVAADFPASTLKAYFSEATDYLIKQAREHAYQNGRGAPVTVKQKLIERYDEQKVLHFLEFVLSPTITMDLPFGIKRLKLTSGEKIDVPDTIRNTTHSRIIRQYNSFCEQTMDNQFKPLGDTSLFAILKGCSASIRKSLAGLDSYSTNGSTAFDILTTLCEELAVYRVKIDEINAIKKVLRQSRNYLKLEYKLHISKNSSVPDHCSSYALRDSTESAWFSSCEDHDHNDRCEDCVLLDATLNLIKSLIDNNIYLSDNQRHRYQFVFKRQCELIQEWKKHQLRAVHQETAKDWVLEQLDETSAFLQIDWAMKWLQLKYRESQNEWFGKKGLPWHLTHVIRAKQSSTTSPSVKSFEHRTICHVFNYCGQTGRTVVSILCDILKSLRLEDPKLETVYLRADNAGCYHGSEFLLSVKKLYEETGVLIRRIDFSEAQAGKGPCDRKAAVIKGEIRRYVNEKHDCSNNVQFVAAAKSTQHLSIFACQVTDVNKNKVNLPDITKYNNIEFEFRPINHTPQSTSTRNNTPDELLMKTWRAFQIGAGKTIKWSGLKSTVNTIETLETVVEHVKAEWKLEKIGKENSENDEDETEDNNSSINDDNDMDVDQPSMHPRLVSSGFYVFDCADPQCIKQFRRFSNLENHLTTGKHVYKRNVIPLLDHAKLVYQQLLESDTSRVQVTLNNFRSTTSPIASATSNVLLQGWALAKKKPPTHYSVDVISFLHDAFEQGVVTGNKWDPVTLSQEMIFTEMNGQPRFNESDCLSPEQIKAFFSKLKSKKSKQFSQSQSSNRSISSSLTTSAASSQNYYNMDINQSQIEKATNDNDDSDEQQTLDEEIEDFESIVEATQLHHLRSMAMKSLPSSTEQ